MIRRNIVGIGLIVGMIIPYLICVNYTNDLYVVCAPHRKSIGPIKIQCMVTKRFLMGKISALALPQTVLLGPI
jgi:hypothetical protein